MNILKNSLFFLLAIVLFISCKKEYSYEAGNILKGGTWQFQDSIVQYKGNIDSATINDVSGTKVLTLVGKSLTGQENFRIHLYTSDSFTLTSYHTSLSESDFDYFTSSKTIFKGDFFAGEFIITITSLSNNTITGTFAGQVEDSTGTLTQITLGAFTSAIDLRNNGSQGGSTSTGTLGANPDTCTPINILGNYKTGAALTDSNTVQVQVNVTTPGSYSIATNSVNGVDFIKSGTFTTTGIQNVILNGSGTPIAPGVQYFTVTYGSSNCTFPITFLQGTVPVGDYFPTTTNSNWAYGLEGGSSSDSILNQVIPYAPTIGGNIYSSFEENTIPSSGSATDTSYYRKLGNDYITTVDVSSNFQLDAPVQVEYTFLNDLLPVNSSIKSANFSGTILSIPVTGYVKTTIIAKAVPVTIGSLTFDDVIKVSYGYYLTINPNIPVATEEKWFARGVGLIYDDINDTDIYDIGRYTVF